jgi:hypothetical protein
MVAVTATRGPRPGHYLWLRIAFSLFYGVHNFAIPNRRPLIPAE